jgi:hypothetical protein
MFKTLPITLAASMILASTAFARPAVRSDEASPAAIQGRRLIEDMRNAIVGVGVQTDALEAMRRNADLSRENYMDDLTVLSEDLNRAGHDLATLQAEQDQLAPWEQEAISKTGPLLKDAADNANRAIQIFKEHQNQMWAYRAYWDDLSTIGSDSQRAAITLGNFLRLEKAISNEATAREHLGQDAITK